MEFTGFCKDDFAVFDVEGLEQRMERLKETLRPKLEQIGADLAPFLSKLTEQEMYAHVARHARRKTNPPSDSWVAWSHNPRGYKMFPHFQVGAWSSHAFIQWGIIYESPHKAHFGEKLIASPSELLDKIPSHFAWYPDHTVNRGYQTMDLDEAGIKRLAERLISNKNGELMVGIEIPRKDAVKMSPKHFLKIAQETFKQLIVLHRAAMSFNEAEAETAGV